MKELGLPFLLLASFLTAFKVILESVDRLNALRDLVLNIDEKGERLSPDQKEILLKHNFTHLLTGTACFCVIFTLLLFGLPLYVRDLSWPWDYAAIYAVSAFVLSCTISILLTAWVDRKRMKDQIAEQRCVIPPEKSGRDK